MGMQDALEELKRRKSRALEMGGLEESSRETLHGHRDRSGAS